MSATKKISNNAGKFKKSAKRGRLTIRLHFALKNILEENSAKSMVSIDQYIVSLLPEQEYEKYLENVLQS